LAAASPSRRVSGCGCGDGYLHEETRGGVRGLRTTTCAGVALDEDASRSRSLAAAVTARLLGEPVERFDWRRVLGGAGTGRGAAEFALDVSGWAVEPGEVFLRFLGWAISSAFCGSIGSVGAVSVGRTTELEPEVGQRRDQAHARGAPIGMEDLCGRRRQGTYRVVVEMWV
jgi:hypothetical protein